jgi:hypothetical protein
MNPGLRVGDNGCALGDGGYSRRSARIGSSLALLRAGT